MTAGPLTLEDLERLERYWRELLTASNSDAVGAARDVLRLTAALRSVMAEHAKCADRYAAGVAERNDVACGLEDRLAAVMAERDRAESHAKRAERLAHDLQAQVLALRSLFVNWRWDGPAWIKPEEHRAMEEANRLAGGKPLDQ